MMPTYMVIGAAKCGTTSLCHGLGSHPDVFMSRPKEIHYFGRDDPAKTLDWYTAHFDRAEDYVAVGEGSTSYTHPHIIEACAREIRDRVPDVRLIYMVRHPLRRLESDWRMRRHEGWAEGSINEEALKQDTLVSHGMYWRSLSVYRRLFSDDQILVVFLEDFAMDQTGELRRCFAHIGVSSELTMEDPGKNRSKNLREDLPTARWIRRLGLVSLARSFTPRPVFELAKRALTRPHQFAVTWDADVRSDVLSRLRDDSLALLDFCNKPSDFWTYHDTP